MAGLPIKDAKPSVSILFARSSSGCSFALIIEGGWEYTLPFARDTNKEYLLLAAIRLHVQHKKIDKRATNSTEGFARTELRFRYPDCTTQNICR